MGAHSFKVCSVGRKADPCGMTDQLALVCPARIGFVLLYTAGEVHLAELKQASAYIRRTE
jgi:hypothetical protein